MASYTNTKDGKVEAPSWYKNADGSTPSTMQKGLTKEQWEAQNASVKQKKESEAKQVQAKEKASAYLKDGGSRDDKYNSILKEGGLNNTSYQKMVGADKKQKFDQQKKDRKESAQAYAQSRKDIQAAGAKAGKANIYSYQKANDNEAAGFKAGKYNDIAPGEDDNMRERNALIRTFQESGYDYNYADIQRHQNQGKENKTIPGLYDKYGGYDNWYNNHSIYSGENAYDKYSFEGGDGTTARRDVGPSYTYDLGNFRGSQDVMGLDTVLEQGKARQDAMQNYQTSNEFKNKYSKYDWAN